ncbi:MAG: LPS export ABC transporter periplasmic protein LptC [Halothece sp. Uz-M2-17]|nr:LPS export ABC transporter periplasmic protein LptC [Halothece sp. Uz-M2-17]
MKTLLDHNVLVTLISLQFLLRKTTAWLLIGVLFWSLSACRSNEPITDADSEGTTQEETIEEQLILENATLNQVDSEGKTLWKLEVKRVVYRQDDQNAELESVTGELYDGGEIFLKIQANQGKIIDDGTQINLEGEVIATDPRNGATLNTEKVEWSPQDRLLTIPQPLNGQHPRFNVTANEGKYYTNREELVLIGNVEGFSEDPPLQLQGEKVNWLIAQEIVKSEQPLQVDRYDPETETIRDRVTANSGEVKLEEKMVFLEDNVEFKSSDPPLQAASNTITWDVEEKVISSRQPIQVVQTEDEITLTGNQGQINLNTEIAQFEGGVKGVSASNQATLFANRLRWNLPTQEMEAEGNVIYEQSDPPLTTQGKKARGILNEENIVVTGDQEQRVTTEIVP